ncbi:4-coumarate--CoA ligase 1-like [Cimex lectularius]|uniref:Luciferin 4-monooxygenase n=1 Tax=Cimex lectularius TaxID=79782 RepID=A0A8I6RYR0_CIMLE|nr:4-coumarate--CoA ligase 1-like [Cimex lectularius]
MHSMRSLRRVLSGLPYKKLLEGEAICKNLVVSPRTYSSQYVDSPFGDLVVPEITIQERIFKDLDKWPEHTALVCGLTGRSYTYAQLRVLSRKVAAGFIKSGLKQGQVVALVLPNLPEFMIAMLGAFQAGLVVSTINPLYAPEEINHQLSNSEASLVITFPMKVGDVKEAIEKSKSPNKPPIVVIHNLSESLPDGVKSFMELLMVQDADESAVDKINVNHTDLALLLYSSGTTGLPKGVRLTHRNIVSNLTQVDHPAIRLAYETTKNYQDATACVLPFFHVYGLSIGALTYLGNGTKLVTLPRFEPEPYLKILKQHKISIAHVVPPLVQFMANHPSVTESYLESLRCCINGAAAISLSDAKKLLAKKHMIVMSGYGLTESSPVITSSRNTTVNLQTVGHVMPGAQVKIVNTETKETIDPGQPGEICCRGPQIMEGYHKNEEATSSTLVDGWLHTGDVGYFDDIGQLFIVDRIKELIKVKGFQVAPLELEEVMKQHPSVADVGVVGKPDSRVGEVPIAFVVKKPGASCNEKELQQFVASKVAEYKQIGGVIFCNEIPKNMTGKILRRELKESLCK